jgi:hypothetical protein
MKIQPIAFSTLRNCKDNRPVIVGDLSPSQLVAELNERTRSNAASKDGPAFMVVTFKDDPLRQVDQVESVTALVLDCDQGEPFKAVRARLDALELAYLAYPTFFHGRTKNPGEASEDSARDRARVLIFLTEAVPASEYDAWYPRAADFVVGPGNWDSAAKDAARLHYLPVYPPGFVGGLVDRTGEDRRALDPWRDVPPAFPVEPVKEAGRPDPSGLPKPWEAFSALHGLEDLVALLEQAGYHSRAVDSRTRGVQLARPGKKAADGRSVSVWPGDSRGAIVKVFSSNCEPLREGEVYDAFGLLVALEHAGDAKAATRVACAWLDARGIAYAKTQDRVQERQPGTKKGAESSEDRQGRAAVFLETHAKTPGELYDLPDESRDFVVEGLLPASSLCLLAAKPKVGKSTLSRHIGQAVATGEDVLGRKVKTGPVVYLALEEKAGEVRDHFRRMELPEDAPLVTVCYPAGDLGLELVKEAIERYRPMLVIVDPIFKLVRVSDTSDYAELTNKLEGLLTLARDSSACILALHHARKGVASEQDTDSVLGSTGLAAAVDNLILLGREKGERTIETIQRYGSEMPRTRLQLCEDGRSMLGHEISIERKAEAEEVVLSFIEANPGCIASDLKEKTEMRNQLRTEALQQLMDGEKIRRTGKGGKGDPYRYFANVEDPLENAVPYSPHITREQGTESFEPEGPLEALLSEHYSEGIGEHQTGVLI